MKYFWILLFMLLHYGLTKMHYGATKLHYGATKLHYGVTKRGQMRSKIPRVHPPTKRCRITKGHAHLLKAIRGIKLCSEGSDQPGNKRDEILPSRFDESREFGSMQASNAARRSGLFRNNGESMLPYPPLLNGPMSANAFRNRADDEDDGGMDDLDEREEESRRFPPDLRQPAMRSPNNFAPFPFMNPAARDGLRVPYDRSQVNFAPQAPAYPMPMNPYNTVNENRNMMPNGNFPGGDQLDNALERYMYGLTIARTPHRSSLNIPADFARSQPDLSNMPNSGLLFPPYNGPLPLRDQTVVPSVMSGMDMPPQGEMQVAPRPLSAPFFMAQRNGDLSGGLYRRGDMTGRNNMPSNYDKPEAPLRDPLVGERGKEVNEPAPDVAAMSNIFNDIASDEKEYKENVGTNLAAQRKDVVQRRDYNRGYTRPRYRTSIYDDNIDSGSPEQNYLERKYELVLNTIANTDNFLRDKANSENPDMLPIGSSSMGNMRNEESMFSQRTPYGRSQRTYERNERTPYGRYVHNNFDLNAMMDGYHMMPDK